MIWEFWKYEKHHGKKSTAYDVVLNGDSREFIFVNKPKNQRVCHCQKCGTKIPREVPRIKFDASYYYGAGYYCLSCGIKKLQEKHQELDRANQEITKEMKNLEELMKIADEVMNDEWYPKKMALGRMLQVIEENQKNY